MARKPRLRAAVGDRVMLAADRADPDAAERKDPGFSRGLADDFDDLAHVDARFEVGGVFKREVRHGGSLPRVLSRVLLAYRL